MRFTLLLCCLLACACDETPVDCVTDEDCADGFRCDHGTFAGDCVKRVRVVPCGNVYCHFPEEQCVDNACVTEVLPDSGGADGAGGVVERDGGEIEGDMGRDRPDGPVDAVPEPRITIQSPADGGVYVDDLPRREGEIRDLDPDARVTLVVDDAEPEMLSTNRDGGFSERLDLLPGPHRVAVIVEQGRHRVEAAIDLRVDFFVRARNGQLWAGEAPFRFVGLNMPALLESAVAHLVDGADDRVSAAYARAREMGATVVRTRAYDDRPEARTGIQIAKLEYNEAALQALDHVIAKAGEAGVKLILPLIGRGDAYGGVKQYLRWGGYLVPVSSDRRRFYLDGPIREHVKDHVRFILGRTNSVNGLAYRNDPAILAWELIDGLDEPGAFDDGSGNEVLGFITTLSQIVKGNDDKHLVATGDMGFDINPTAYGRHYDALRDAGLAPLYDGSHGVPWHRATRLGTVDLAVVHLDPSAFSFPHAANQYANLGAAWLRGHASLAALESKPMVVLQTRMTSAPVDLNGRRQALRAWFDEALSLELAGFCVGNYYPDGADIGDDRAAWTWQTGTEAAAPANQYADQIRTFATEVGNAP